MESTGYGSPDSPMSHLAGSRDDRINLLAICNPFRDIRIQKLGSSELGHKNDFHTCMEPETFSYTRE